jgi:hypothetical protein
LSVLDEATPVGQISQSESSDARQVLWRRSTHPTKERKLPADAIVQPPLSFVRGVVLFGIGGFAVLAVVIASSHADVVHARAGFVDTGTAVRTELGGIVPTVEIPVASAGTRGVLSSALAVIDELEARHLRCPSAGVPDLTEGHERFGNPRASVCRALASKQQHCEHGYSQRTEQNPA